MDYERMLATAAARQGGHGTGGGDQPMPDNGEVIHISSLALLKMLKHGRAGVPMEVMGLMLGEFVDDYTVQVIDVFAMPQSGTSVTVESVDHSLIHGLNRHYYSIAVDYRKTELEQAMLMNLHKRNWTEGLRLRDFGALSTENENAVKSMLKLSEAYTKSVEEESTLTPEQLATRHVGKQDPKRHLEDAVERAMGNQVVQSLGTMLLAEL
ncbi:multicatalytic endopeptidase [Ceratobasidium sp. UAMH 11750]|nr:multicatalytic endopeptidase [Ceratobasidium sp. UAMH 11750]